jgi:hypothetical protein
MRFDFIRQAMDEVHYPRFFHCEPLTKWERKRLDTIADLPPSYVEFLEAFGRAKFFRQLDRDVHDLEVFPPPEEMHFYGDSYMFDIGARAYSAPVSFKFSEFAPGAEPPIYDIALGIAPAAPRRRAESFTDWLTKSWVSCRRKYSRKAWATVLSGPVPFTSEELRICEIRNGFSWRQLPPHDGKVVVEFKNGSTGYLHYYSIGVRDRDGIRMTGGFRVDVSHIAPGTTAVLELPMGGYEHLLTAEISVLFDKGDPRPESRNDFWEFRKP